MPWHTTRRRSWGTKMGRRYYVFLDKSQRGLERAAASGSPHAVGILAVEMALRHCDQGFLPREKTEAFLLKYLDNMAPEVQGRYIPLEHRTRVAADYLQQYNRTVEGTLNGLSAHLEELCAAEVSWDESLLPVAPED